MREWARRAPASARCSASRMADPCLPARSCRTRQKAHLRSYRHTCLRSCLRSCLRTCLRRRTCCRRRHTCRHRRSHHRRSRHRRDCRRTCFRHHNPDSPAPRTAYSAPTSRTAAMDRRQRSAQQGSVLLLTALLSSPGSRLQPRGRRGTRCAPTALEAQDSAWIAPGPQPCPPRGPASGEGEGGEHGCGERRPAVSPNSTHWLPPPARLWRLNAVGMGRVGMSSRLQC